MILSRIVSGIIALGVLWAGVVLGRLVAARRVNWIRRMRGLIVGLATYGSMIFINAAIAGVSVRDALRPGGLLHVLPLVLQGAFIGGFIILPLGCVAAIIQVGISRFRKRAPRPIWFQSIALITCLALLVTSVEMPNEERRHSTPGQLIAQLDRSLRAIEDAEREAPRDRWDPDYVVQTVGRDPQKLFEWVRDNTFWIPYRGVLRGPSGVLMDGQCNSLDRSMLLATMLRHAGSEVRLAHGTLTHDQAAKLVPDLFNRRAQLLAPPSEIDQPDAQLESIVKQYQLDGSAVRNGVERQTRILDAVDSELNKRVTDQTSRLLANIEKPDQTKDWTKRFEEAVEALRDHWWVQRREGPTWIDFDVLDDQAAPGTAATTAEETLALEDLPKELHQEIVIRVNAERWSNGALSQERVLENVVRPAELLGQPITLLFWPAAWPSTIHSDPNSKYGLKGIALEQDAWMATLSVNQKSVAAGIIKLNSNTQEPAASNPFSALAGAAGKAFSQQEGSKAAASELTAVWIEYEIHSPGEPPRIVRRTVFDLLDSASQSSASVPRPLLDETQKLKRSLSLMMRTEILPVTAEIAPEFVAHLAAQSALNNRDLLRAAVRLTSATALPDGEDYAKLLGASAPTVSPLYTLAVMRTGWGRDDLVVDRLNILTRHQYPALVNGTFTLRDDVDIVENELGVGLSEIDAFSVRVARGVFDTNAEALMGTESRAENTGEAFRASSDWATLTPSRREGLGQLQSTDSVRRRLKAELAASRVIVVPKQTVSLAGRPFVGWWRIDPVSGTTLGVSANGWGDAGVDYVMVLKTVSAFWSGAAFEYGMCQATVVVGTSLQYFGNIRANDTIGQSAEGMKAAIKQSVGESNRTCLITAIIAGALATLPIIISTMKYSRMARRLASPPVELPAPRTNVPQPGNVNSTKLFHSVEPVPDVPRGVYNRKIPPPGAGPYQRIFDADSLNWLRREWADPVQNPAARAIGPPEWYEQSNAAARAAYNQARTAGYTDGAARQFSYETYMKYLNKFRAMEQPKVAPAQSGLTISLILSAAFLSFIPHATDASKGGS